MKSLKDIINEIKLDEVKPFVDNQLRKKWSYPLGDNNGLVYLATNDKRYPTELVVYNINRHVFHFMHSQMGKWSNPTQENVPADKLSSTHWVQPYFEEWQEDFDYEKGFKEGKLNENPYKGKTKSFQPGDMWSNDFDYVGMLKYGAQVPDIPTDVGRGEHMEMAEGMEELFDSFTDVNYHTEARDLGNAIDWVRDAKGIDDIEKANDFLEMFRMACMKTLKEWKIKWRPMR